MRILITGNLGYVGPVLVKHLRARFPEAELIGYDQAYFAHCLTGGRAMFPEAVLDKQLFGDVRDLSAADLEGVTGVVLLAAVSNDPMGNRFETVTEQINQDASVRIARLARDAGVRNLVFASSCSVYGAGGSNARTEQDPTNPLTAYARSKIGTENALAETDTGDMVVTSLRFATACGMSPRLRLDLVLNDFVACALSSHEITVLSDGKPWRPLIDVADMARAVEWALGRSADQGGRKLVINTGSDIWNYQVKDLAEAVVAQIPGTSLSINTAAPPDGRSYRVDFSLYRDLAPEHQPIVTLQDSIGRLVTGLQAFGFNDPEFRKSPLIRLHTLSGLIEDGAINHDLRWNWKH